MNLVGLVNLNFFIHILQHAIDSVLKQMIQYHNIPTTYDKMFFSMKMLHKSFENLNKRFVYLPPRTHAQNSAFALTSLLQKLQQSAEGIGMGEGLRLTITARPGNLFGGADGEDNLCLVRSFMRAFQITKFKETKEKLQARYGKKTIQDPEFIEKKRP